ncbi:ATP synthase mitochondrial F1 complex assembly factor 2, partial [Stegodyphus mimosarum]
FNHRKFSFHLLSRNFAAPRKRFYKKVHVFESNGGFEICLDKYKLKTPLGNLLHLPNEALAVAVATEWDIQQDTLQQHNMHITALCNTALDNPCRQTKETIVDSTLQFLAAD